MLVAEWKQVIAAMLQYLVESLPRGAKAIIAARGEGLHINYFEMRCSMSRCPLTYGHVLYCLLA
jgi:hypothetical protein